MIIITIGNVWVEPDFFDFIKYLIFYKKYTIKRGGDVKRNMSSP